VEPINLINLNFLMDRTSGSPDIKIGLIDGPVSVNHSSINYKNIIEIPGRLSGSCSIADSIACNHGTFIAGILKAKRSSIAPAICPDCTLLVRSVFSEHTLEKNAIPSSSPHELSKAILDCIKAGAQIINLSLAIAYPTTKGDKELENILTYAANLGVIIVAAAGNQGVIGSTSLTRHPWVIPVIACNKHGKPMQMSNLSNSIGRNGLSAPGENITSLGSKNNNITFSGTSVATPIVTGIIALLFTLFPHLPGSAFKLAVTFFNKRRSVVPPLVDARRAYEYLKSNFKQKRTYEKYK
jgi:subtilisin family serine protease